MAPKRIDFMQLGNGPKVYQFIGFGDIHGHKAFKFIGFREILGTREGGLLAEVHMLGEAVVGGGSHTKTAAGLGQEKGQGEGGQPSGSWRQRLGQWFRLGLVIVDGRCRLSPHGSGPRCRRQF